MQVTSAGFVPFQEFKLYSVDLGFIIHGRYGKKQSLNRELEQIFTGIPHRIFFTEYPGHTIQLVKDLVVAGCSHIVVCGGDGSLNEAVNGIMFYPESSRPILAVLPFGTGNDFIKSIGSPPDFVNLKTSLLSGKTMVVDVANATLFDRTGKPIQRFFINIAEVGIGGLIAEKLSKSSKFFGSFITYQYYILSTLLTYKPQVFSYSTPKDYMKKKMMNLVIANGRFFAGGLCISPNSNLQDELLNIVELGDLSTWDYLVNLPTIKAQKKVVHPQVKYSTTKTVDIQSNNPMPVDMDGEHAGFTPLQVNIVPSALRFVV